MKKCSSDFGERLEQLIGKEIEVLLRVDRPSRENLWG